MEFEGSRLLLTGTSADDDLYDLICSQSVSDAAVSSAVVFYVLATLLAGFIDLSAFYDVIGIF